MKLTRRHKYERKDCTDSSLKYHIANAKNHGVSQKEMAALITHVAFYAVWPKAWAVFNLAKEVYDEQIPELTDKDKYQNTIFLPIGNPNDAYAYLCWWKRLLSGMGQRKS